MTEEEAAKAGCGFVPTSGGPVAVVYNLPGVSISNYPARYCLQIFPQTRWNDPCKREPGVNLPDQPIRLAVRADSSGMSHLPMP